MKNKINNIQVWINKNSNWLILIVGLIALVILTDVADIVTSFSRGFNEGFSRCKDCPDDVSKYSFGFSVLILIIVCVTVALLFIILKFTLNLFYIFFFKVIFRENKILNIISFAIWFLFFYNLIGEGILWMFEKNKVYEKSTNLTASEHRDLFASALTALFFLLIIIYSLVKNFVINAKTQAQLIAQKSQAELTALKAQINPHFLFNVLNNLYGSAIIEESPKTSEGILQLSSIMRHVVEGTKNEKIEVEKEIRFLHDFIELNKMRIPNRPNIRIETDIYWDENPAQIAPLLVIPYIENAFKYGISINEESFIEMSFRVENQQLTFICKNSIIKLNDKLEVGTGTGLENTKRRLNLYYPAGYQLATNSTDNVFTVSLIVNL